MPSKKENKKAKATGVRVFYGDSVTVLPMTAADAVGRASGLDCKILMLICADPSLRTDAEDAVLRIADAASCSTEEVNRALAYFSGAGVLEYAYSSEKKTEPSRVISSRTESQIPETPASAEKNHSQASDTKKLQRSDELPNYSIEELAVLLENRKTLSIFLDECQRAYGKIFNPRDVNVILAMVDYLSLNEEYILILLRYFGTLPEEERKSIHYIERMAISLVNDGITDVPSLDAYLERLNKLRDHQGEIREIFGMGSRAFTAKEKKSIMQWLGEFEVGMDLIRAAYERTVNATGKPSVLYASKILERWHSEGIKSEADLTRSEAEKEERASENFGTDDFFEAALRRSYGDSFEAETTNTSKEGE